MIRENPNDPKSDVLLSAEEYEELLDKIDLLEALQEGGVDNWKGFEYAIDIYYVKGPKRRRESK